MVFRDQMLVCQECGKTFFWTVTEQRRQAEQFGEDGVKPPELCPSHRNLRSAPTPVRPEPTEHRKRADRPEPVEQVEKVEVKEPKRRAPQVQRERRAERAQHAHARDDGPQAPVIEVDDFPLEDEGIELKLIGAVKWFNRNKGYGFVTMADGQEVFFHRSDVVGVHLSQIKDGMQVEFQIRRTEKGTEAFNVSPLPAR
jgi:CspA family cold shock protein